jgi:hypothetical protein
MRTARKLEPGDMQPGKYLRNGADQADTLNKGICMPRSMRAVIATVFATMLAVGALVIAPAATAAPSHGGRVTQADCQARNGTYSSTKGTKTCTVTTSTTASDPTPVLGSTQLDSDNTYYAGTFHKETTTTTTTTTTQRGNATPTTTTQTTTTDTYVADQCQRIDHYHQVDETVTTVDNSECNTRITQFRYI